MRVSREVASQNRDRIVATASRIFREKGFQGIGVDGLMNEAGLTHGGFYGHFASREDLVVEALSHALQNSPALSQGYEVFADFVEDYLSQAHIKAVGSGCALAAFANDVPHQGPAVRRSFTGGLVAFLERLEGLMGQRFGKRRREKSLATASTLIGAVILARAVSDPELKSQLLEAAKRAVKASDGTSR